MLQSNKMYNEIGRKKKQTGNTSLSLTWAILIMFNPFFPGETSTFGSKSIF